ncbi:hypothetical protein H5410_056879 [Solanum commersonii]|uniref:Uncharacterized protein n=1 Tax=Solanum commersonii TaxID=4109 RepID=A0A9J5WLE9_SOLCO|nr:hypothetical protein H5410_056879 [Solanum commersonii]
MHFKGILFTWCNDKEGRHKKIFRFLKFWIEIETFIDVVKQNWKIFLKSNKHYLRRIPMLKMGQYYKDLKLN